MSSGDKWQKVFHEAGQHRVFKQTALDSLSYGRLAIADGSGANPSLTDDGPLYLPRDGGTVWVGKGGFRIAVERIDGSEVGVAISAALAYWLTSSNRWQLRITASGFEIETDANGVAVVRIGFARPGTTAR